MINYCEEHASEKNYYTWYSTTAVRTRIPIVRGSHASDQSDKEGEGAEEGRLVRLYHKEGGLMLGRASTYFLADALLDLGRGSITHRITDF